MIVIKLSDLVAETSLGAQHRRPANQRPCEGGKRRPAPESTGDAMHLKGVSPAQLL
jgi:hypothetical protein